MGRFGERVRHVAYDGRAHQYGAGYQQCSGGSFDPLHGPGILAGTDMAQLP
jgi:hypothetical protein